MTQDKTYHLAQANIALGAETVDHPSMESFTQQIDEVNKVADKSPGFVWRFQTDEGDATSLIIYDDPRYIFNMSVWESVEALRQYAFTARHLRVLQQQKEWFVKIDRPHSVLWWIPAGTIPSVSDALERLEVLRDQGPGPRAFTFASLYDPHGVPMTAGKSS